MLKNGVFLAELEWNRGNEGLRVPKRANAKRGDLRAYLGLVEGLYHLEGFWRFTGISEGFMGKK